MKELTLEITNQCMNKCLHCSSNCTYDKNNIIELSFDKIKQLIEEHSPELVNISGGEPLEHTGIIDILNYLENNKIQHNLYTSLYPIKENFLNILEIFQHKYLKIILPFHSYNNTINDMFMSKTGITEILKNWIDVLRLFKINNSVHIVPTILNIYTLDDTIQYLIDEGINDIKILKLVVQGRCEEYKDIELSDDILKTELNKLQEKYDNKIKLGLPFNEGECIAGKEKLVVMCDGKIIPCESYKDGVCKCKRI